MIAKDEAMLMNLAPRRLARFINNLVKKTRKAPSGCIEWTGSLNWAGYGKIQVRFAKGHNSYLKAHRMSYSLFVDSIPDGLFVLHKCDNPKCVNPLHLFLGTQQANMADKVSKVRHLRGEDSPHATMTEAQVKEARALWVPRKVTCRQIAERLGVGVAAVQHAVAGDRWQHV